MRTILSLIGAVIIGIIIGYVIPESLVNVVLAVRQISGQLIFFLIPLIIVGFVAPSISAQKGNVSRTLLIAFALAYFSSVGAAFFSAVTAQYTIPLLNITTDNSVVRELPEQLFKVEIPPVMNVMTALTIAVLLGLGTLWTSSDVFEKALVQFRAIVLNLVSKILVPILPFYIAANFAALSFEGTISRLWVFLPVILIVIVMHYIWLALLYSGASLYTGKNGWQVLRHYFPAYLTALGTMSSAATLGVALQCAHKSDVLKKDTVDFGIPLFSNIHLCGSVLTEVFFVCVVSQLLYGSIPSFSTLALFIILLGIFAVGAPGVPGGTVLASLGIVISVLQFDDAGTAMLIAIFALQDSFGTACNVTGDGALTLIIDKVRSIND
ncbi:MAG: dicarboxylate/amino acid:cation symporter [Bacteroidales bacterium]|nr:dicarboxylate/amino acid:cation symporter [Bacteroidales bacterium]